MDNASRVDYGCKAIAVGTPDFGMNGEDLDGFVTDAGDTVANILHAVNKAGGLENVELVLERAQTHFHAELDEESVEQEFDGEDEN